VDLPFETGMALAARSAMEGPSIRLAAEQLQPFVGRRVRAVSGNSRIGIAQLAGRKVREIFPWGKHLVIQFERFGLRVHFLLWGTFAADVQGVSVTGDYRRAGPPRLVLEFANGVVTIWSASLRLVEGASIRETYDFTIDILSDSWDPRNALKRIRARPSAEIADVLLDQAIFAGVGNIIKNEVLFRTRTNPTATVRKLSDRRLEAIVADARVFSFRFLELRRRFALRAHLEVYGRSACTVCGGRILRRVHGVRGRRTFFCQVCQRVRSVAPTGRRRQSRARSRVPRQ
jgi:endonuclease-8